MKNQKLVEDGPVPGKPIQAAAQAVGIEGVEVGKCRRRKDEGWIDVTGGGDRLGAPKLREMNGGWIEWGVIGAWDLEH